MFSSIADMKPMFVAQEDSPLPSFLGLAEQVWFAHRRTSITTADVRTTQRRLRNHSFSTYAQKEGEGLNRCAYRGEGVKVIAYVLRLGLIAYSGSTGSYSVIYQNWWT